MVQDSNIRNEGICVITSIRKHLRSHVIHRWLNVGQKRASIYFAQNLLINGTVRNLDCNMLALIPIFCRMTTLCLNSF